MDGKPALEDVIERYTGARPSKRMIHCPLHEDQTPSCSVNYTRQLWNCHSCGNGGDSWKLIEIKEDCDFKTAVMLAQKYDLGMMTRGEEEHGNRFTGTRVVARDKRGKRIRYRPKFARTD